MRHKSETDSVLSIGEPGRSSSFEDEAEANQTAPGVDLTLDPNDDLREFVVQAGLEVLDRDGLGLRADSITYAKVFAYLESEHGIRVTRASVHQRIWTNQDEFRTEVIATAVNMAARSVDSFNLTAVGRALIAEFKGVEANSETKLLEYARIIGWEGYSEIFAAEEFSRHQALKAAARSDSRNGAGSDLSHLINLRSQEVIDARRERLRSIVNWMGVKPKTSLGLSMDESIDFLNTICIILIAGTHLDHNAGYSEMAKPTSAEPIVIDSLGGPWMPFSLALRAFFSYMFEPTQPDDPIVELPRRRSLRVVADNHKALPDERKGPESSRRSRAELKRLVLSAAVELLHRNGLGLQPESLTYKSVFDHIREKHDIVLHRSSVHQRFWASQDEFRLEVLARAASYGPDDSYPKMLEALAATGPTRDKDGLTNIRQTLLDQIRTVADAHVSVASASPRFARWQSVKAAMLSQPLATDTEVLRAAMRERYNEIIPLFAQSFGVNLKTLGLSVRPELGLGHDETLNLWSIIATTMAVGSDFDVSSGNELAAKPVLLPRVDGSGAKDEWTPLAVAAVALMDMFFQYDLEGAS